jgi:hypothetical protein
MQDPLTKLAAYVEGLGIKSRNVGALKLAKAIREEGDIIAAVNKIYSHKSASWRAGAIGVLSSKQANMMQPMQVPPQAQVAPQMGAQQAMIQSPNGARASALMNRLTGGVQQMQQQQVQAAPQEGMQ